MPHSPDLSQDFRRPIFVLLPIIAYILRTRLLLAACAQPSTGGTDGTDDTDDPYGIKQPPPTFEL